MAHRLAPRRPPARPPMQPVSAPAQMLAARRSTHLRDAVGLIAAGLGGFGAAAIAGYPQWSLPVLALGVVGGVATAVAGHRTKARDGLHDRLVEALAPWLGVRQLDRRTVRLRSWTTGWPGLPRRITLHYAPGAADADPLWKTAITDVVAARLLATYKLASHDPRRCRLQLKLLKNNPDAPAEPPRAQVRAERAITELIGPTVKVTAAEFADDEQLRSITVTHQAGAKLAASGYRARIERVISTMMPGRWRAVWDLEGDSVRFEVRPTLPTSVWLPTETADNPEDLLGNYRDVKIPLAIDEDGREVLWYPARVPHLMVTGGTGTGKALALTTALPTPAGWTTMGEVHVGDVLFDERGMPCRVTGVFDQPLGRPCNEVIFDDGSVLVADDAHLWWTEDAEAGGSRRRARADHWPRARIGPCAVRRLSAALQAAYAEDTFSITDVVTLTQGGVSARLVRRAAATLTPVTSRRVSVRATHRDADVYSTPLLVERLRAYACCRARPGTVLSESVPILSAAASRRPAATITLEHLASQLGVCSRTDARDKHPRIVLARLHGPTATKTVRLSVGREPRYPARELLTVLLRFADTSENDQRSRRRTGQVHTTAEIAATVTTARGHPNHSIPVCRPLVTPPAQLPIPPYVLGVWLGDGHTISATLTIAEPQIRDLLADDGVQATPTADPAMYRLAWAAPPSAGPTPVRTCPSCGNIYQPPAQQRVGSPRCRGDLTRGRARDTRIDRCGSCGDALNPNQRLPTCHGCRPARATFTGSLHALGVLGSKHIPDLYLRASIQQRQALLAGLLDTNGSVTPRGTVQFDSTNQTLAHQVHELALSLGHRATIMSRPAQFNGRDCRPVYRVWFTFAVAPFRLTRKAQAHRQRSSRHDPTRTGHRYITAVRRVPPVPVRCITVDSPSELFLAGRSMIPTHNTSTAQGALGAVTRYGWPVWILDAKRVEFLDFRPWPNVQVIAGSIPQQVALVHRAWQLMEHRYQLIERGKASVNDFEPLVVFLDEFAEFRSNLLEWYAQIKVKGDPTKPPTLAEVASLARKARTARIHLVLSTQRPDVEFLGGEALALHTPLPTPDGWTTMGQIRVGQYVFAENGRPVRVSGATPVMTGRPCYRVTFSDGSSIVTDRDHLWAAHNACQCAQPTAALPGAPREGAKPSQAAIVRALTRSPADERQVTAQQLQTQLDEDRIERCGRGLPDQRWNMASGGDHPAVANRLGGRIATHREVICSPLSQVESAGPHWRPGQPQTVSTGQIARTLHCRNTGSGQESNWSIQVAQPLQLPEAALPVDPWLLGYWLCAGHQANATIATAALQVIDRIEALGHRVQHHARFTNAVTIGGGGASQATLVGAVRELGLLHNKHIPAGYLRASRRQRSQLLAGLLDAAGTCAVRIRREGGPVSGQVRLCTTDARLIEGVAELAASLGFIPTTRQMRAAGATWHASSIVDRRPVTTGWEVTFTPDRQVFGIPRKQRLLRRCLPAARGSRTRLRYIVNIEPVESVPVRCITVDSNTHLYLAGRGFIPTHNCRDNFGQRISLGRLSPQGAMMMWENPAIGVSLPRSCTGRAIATHEDARPVEVQCYRFPDMHAPEGSLEAALLEAIRPSESRHPRLVDRPTRAGAGPRRWAGRIAHVPRLRASTVGPGQ